MRKISKMFNRRKSFSREVEPDEIFLDAQNLPAFNTQQFEGRIDTPISRSVLWYLGIFFAVLGIIIVFKAGNLQIANGESYFKRSESNSLDQTPIFANRGIITDRNGIPLAWNEENIELPFPERVYTSMPGLAHVLGYVTYPAKDKSGKYWQTEYIAKDGAEKIYDEMLRGKNGVKIIETNVMGEVQSENIIDPPVQGGNLVLSIDARVQSALAKYIDEITRRTGFDGGAGVIMDIQTGEILAMTSLPEYDPNIMASGDDRKTISQYLNSKAHPLLNRAISGSYTPGSTVKPFVALAALNEKIISPSKQILSTGALTIPNVYDPSKPTIFKDWKAHGWVDMREAIAMSSDVYFYVVGGGFQDQKGLGIDRIKKYTEMFGLNKLTGIDLPGEITGVIPSIEWKEKNFPGDPWRVGNTYHTSIGQYGFQVTPIAMARAVAMMASNGIPVTPTILRQEGGELKETTIKPASFNQADLDVIHEGMRRAIATGTSNILNVPGIAIAGKSGTAELGIRKDQINAWITGYFPYENPRYSFVVLSEHGPSGVTYVSTTAMRSLVDWMQIYAPEYLK